MSADSVSLVRPASKSRFDRPGVAMSAGAPAIVAAVLVLAAGFVLVGGGNLDPGPIEARLGLAAGERLGPFGQVFGGWEPVLWPAQVAPSILWAQWELGSPTAASVRWPSAIAGVVLGLILARRARLVLGTRAGLLTALCWFGSVALIDRSGGAGLDLVAGLATIGALDRLLGRGSDLVAGLWAALAFLSAGWPPLVLIALTTVVIGRRGAVPNARLLLPPLVAALAWSGWALSVAPVDAWAAALALPLTQKPAWLLGVGVVALGLPWSPLVALTLSRSVRDGWTPEGRALVLGWLQVAGASLLAGTVIPGLASSARLPALAGLLVAAAACADRLWSCSVSNTARRASVGMTAVLVAFWAAVVLAGGTWLAMTIAYYRVLMILLIALALPMAGLALSAMARSDSRRALVALALVAVCLKLAHWGYYVPEWNYRRSQGPWGRAIGQWVPPHWTIHTIHPWPADLAFAARRPFRQLASPQHLGFQSRDRGRPLFVLLLDSEFEHWPEAAPTLVKVASFQDERGRGRVLARTDGEFPWDRAGPDHPDE